MIQYDPTEFQDGLNAKTLRRIAQFYGEDVEDVMLLLDPPAVIIDVGNHSIHTL